VRFHRHRHHWIEIESSLSVADEIDFHGGKYGKRSYKLTCACGETRGGNETVVIL
jgi:hypothetical protein